MPHKAGFGTPNKNNPKAAIVPKIALMINCIRK